MLNTVIIPTVLPLPYLVGHCLSPLTSDDHSLQKLTNRPNRSILNFPSPYLCLTRLLVPLSLFLASGQNHLDPFWGLSKKRIWQARYQSLLVRPWIMVELCERAEDPIGLNQRGHTRPNIHAERNLGKIKDNSANLLRSLSSLGILPKFNLGESCFVSPDQDWICQQLGSRTSFRSIIILSLFTNE